MSTYNSIISKLLIHEENMHWIRRLDPTISNIQVSSKILVDRNNWTVSKVLKKEDIRLSYCSIIYYCVNLICNSALKILNVGLNSYHWIKRVSIIIMIKDQGLVIQSCNLYSTYKLYGNRKLLSKQPASPGQTNCFWGWQHGASDLHHLQYACSGKSSLIHIHNSLG